MPLAVAVVIGATDLTCSSVQGRVLCVTNWFAEGAGHGATPSCPDARSDSHAHGAHVPVPAPDRACGLGGGVVDDRGGVGGLGVWCGGVPGACARLGVGVSG